MGADDELEQRALDARRLGLLILENKGGAALLEGANHLRQAAALWAEAGRTSRQAECLLDLGKLYSKATQPIAAVEAFQEALRLFERSDDWPSACDAACGAGLAGLAAGHDEGALRHLRRALEYAEQLNDHLRLAAVQLHLAQAANQVGQAEEASRAAAAALRIYRDYRQGTKELDCLEQLAHAADLAQDAAAADDHYAACIACCERLGRGFEANRMRSQWADSLSRRNDQRRAIEQLHICFRHYRQVKDHGMQAQTLRLIGMAELKEGAAGDAIASFERSLEHCHNANDRAEAARSRYALANARLTMGQEEQAEQLLGEALADAEASADARLEERIIAAQVRLERSQGHHQRALDRMQRWVAVLKQLGERQEQLHVLGSMAEVHQASGNMDQAEEILRRLIGVCQDDDDEPERLYAEHSLGVLLAGRDRHAAAIPHLETALHGQQARCGDHPHPKERLLLAKLHHQLGNSLLHTGQAEAAVDQFDAALQQHETVDRPAWRARVLVGLGNAYNQLELTDHAKRAFSQAAELCERQGDLRATNIIRKRTEGL